MLKHNKVTVSDQRDTVDHIQPDKSKTSRFDFRRFSIFSITRIWAVHYQKLTPWVGYK